MRHSRCCGRVRESSTASYIRQSCSPVWTNDNYFWLFSEDERAPKAHPFFQRFRIFQDVGSLRVREGLSERPLRLDERDHVVLALASCVGVRVLVGSFPSRGFGQVDIHLDQLITSGPSGARSHGGSSQEDRPLQSMYEGLYFPIAAELEAYLVPSG